MNHNDGALLQCMNVKKVYGRGESRTEALRGVDFSLSQGEMTAIMGPSGCGKTTLLHCLSGMDQITSGEIWFQGQELHSMKEKRKDALRGSAMGFVFQNYNLIPVLTAVENVELPLLSQGVSPSVSRKKAMEALGKVGLHERRFHKPAHMSGGQQQRVALARAMVHNPQIIWADEPTGALDRETTDKVMQLIQHLNREEGTTFVIVTHDPRIASVTSRIVYMDSGKVIHEKRNDGGGM
ncbi:ABC transporter ATP-binding protein [Paenibacillus sp. N3/727]|uniref:ABC transporter ATP-binding protein n=1 Tax=Paenibacillus sp. N3/727 TaxID=2925845 RepID=UPI001F533AC1|nr:ABC transporter ATP-binding protein [Paenibacillus sp. N3/727]UNK19203.1 ABC transporter ATP-binding protein [Paenibacillus sp. N3/727]